MTKSKGSIDGMRALLNLHGFVSVLGWAQDVALSVETPEEAAILIRANAFTRELVPPNNKDLLEAAAAQWGVLLFASRQPPMFGATCFKARKPTVELSEYQGSPGGLCASHGVRLLRVVHTSHDGFCTYILFCRVRFVRLNAASPLCTHTGGLPSSPFPSMSRCFLMPVHPSRTHRND